MKFATALLVGSVSATWNVWNQSAYCDFDLEEIDTTSTIYTEAECAAFCKEADLNALHIPYGTDECCDYEAWSDGSVDCTLYKGDATISDSDTNGFSSMTFESGDYHGYFTFAGRDKVADMRARQ